MTRISDLHNEDGQTAAEYSVILAVITPAIIALLAVFSDEVAARLAAVAGLLS